jgi:hypothetical protein
LLFEDPRMIFGGLMMVLGLEVVICEEMCLFVALLYMTYYFR